MLKFAESVFAVLAAVAVAVILVMFWVWFAILILSFIGLFFLVWACGTRFKITKDINGQKVTIGYLRWTKFTKV